MKCIYSVLSPLPTIIPKLFIMFIFRRDIFVVFHYILRIFMSNLHRNQLFLNYLFLSIFIFKLYQSVLYLKCLKRISRISVANELLVRLATAHLKTIYLRHLRITFRSVTQLEQSQEYLLKFYYLNKLHVYKQNSV